MCCLSSMIDDGNDGSAGSDERDSLDCLLCLCWNGVVNTFQTSFFFICEFKHISISIFDDCIALFWIRFFCFGNSIIWLVSFDVNNQRQGLFLFVCCLCSYRFQNTCVHFVVVFFSFWHCEMSNDGCGEQRFFFGSCECIVLCVFFVCF